MSRALRLSRRLLWGKTRVRQGCGWEGEGQRCGGRRNPPDPLVDGGVAGDPWELELSTIGMWKTSPQSWRERTSCWVGGPELCLENLWPPPQPTGPQGRERDGFCSPQRALLIPQPKGSSCPWSPDHTSFTVSYCAFLPSRGAAPSHPPPLCATLRTPPLPTLPSFSPPSA